VGEFLQAFEEFYDDQVVMRENAGAPTLGKDVNREREKAFAGSIETIHENRAGAVMVDGDRVAIRWLAEYTFRGGARMRFDQVAYQEWQGDRIVSERFYYDPASLAA
jgi:ketosteroid isomerase-like protein